ncbi:cytochrome P450 [Heliocybe sulcata]|uniref:Cytochrome P450 n=1 Tax=Heliocybe sulcata TaxID=5364 RepID=A0A5C3MW62_9AGAM|nr:cytochrome P450 [Heliocybe sulcata]
MTIGAFSLLALAVVLAALYRRSRKSWLSDLPGPESEFMLGNVRQVLRGNVIELMLGWKEEFGSVFRYQSLFGRNIPVISDSKALHHILNVAAYDFPQPNWLRAFIMGFSGPNLVWAEGDTHRRQRRVMAPAFGVRESKGLFPVFRDHAAKLASDLQDALLGDGNRDSIVIDFHPILHTAALGAISEAAFDFQIDKEHTVLNEVYRNFNGDSMPPSKAVLDALVDYVPPALVHVLFKILPFKQIKFLRKHKEYTYQVAKELVANKSREDVKAKKQRDVFSLLLQANTSEESKHRLSDDELYAQMSIIFVAGQDTTSNTMLYTLWELAKHDDVQTRLRNEIRQVQSDIRAQGKSDVTLSDMENMEYLLAVIKEGLRLYPVVFQVSRVAEKDTVLPLSRELKTTSGTQLHCLHIPKGTEVILAIGAYNRDKTIWGQDADEFKPERWLKDGQATKDVPTVGIMGNLLTFLSGPRSCIGWRFAMMEMQCFLAELVDIFEIQVADPKKVMRSEGDNAIYPVINGEEEKGAQMPLRISLASRD